MHPRIQAQREAEAAESIDSAVSALAKRYSVQVEDVSIPVRDPALRSLFKAEHDAAQLKEIVRMSRSSDAREREAVERIEALLAEAGIEAQVRSDDADPAMRTAWSLSAVADVLESLLPKKKGKASKAEAADDKGSESK